MAADREASSGSSKSTETGTSGDEEKKKEDKN